jgi:hypothetical protein
MKKEDNKIQDNEDGVISKHKKEGKHALSYDSIFKGKKEEPLKEDDFDNYSDYHDNNIEVDNSSYYYHESMNNEAYIREKLLKERVYDILSEFTDIKFESNRRKPSKVDFNEYYRLLMENLKNESFTNVELFNELSVYFSDNLFNMFKLLETKWKNSIIDELQEHIGKSKKSKEVENRNIPLESEIEFKYNDHTDKEKIIHGIVIETDYDNSKFKVNSYENIYEVHLNDITRIINNTKFKYNLNKLNNLDFL